jgi:hypothetical protein
MANCRIIAFLNLAGLPEKFLRERKGEWQSKRDKKLQGDGYTPCSLLVGDRDIILWKPWNVTHIA